MSQTEIDEIVSEFRKSIFYISDEEVANVLWLCRRKIEISGRPEDYLKLLLPDELKNHCFRIAVNMISFARMEGYICMAFIEDMSVSEMLSMLGESLIIA